GPVRRRQVNARLAPGRLADAERRHRAPRRPRPPQLGSPWLALTHRDRPAVPREPGVHRHLRVQPPPRLPLARVPHRRRPHRGRPHHPSLPRPRPGPPPRPNALRPAPTPRRNRLATLPRRTHARVPGEDAAVEGGGRDPGRKSGGVGPAYG